MAHTYLVTGANRGLGLEFVRQLAARGDRVIAAVRDPGKAGDIRGAAQEVVTLDAADAKSIERLAATLKGKPIDVLINNAGVIGEDRTIEKVTLEEFQRVFTLNTFGPALLTRALLPNLRAGSRKMVLNISSTLGSISGGMAGFSYAYRMSKAALNMLTKATHDDLAKEGFIVVSFCPGWNRTDMGGAEAPLDPKESIASLLRVESKLTKADSGTFLSHEGKGIGW